MGFQESVHVLVIWTRDRDPDVGQILTTADAPSPSALVEACGWEVGKRSQLEEVFLSSSLELRTDNCLEYLCAFIADFLGLTGSPCL